MATLVVPYHLEERLAAFEPGLPVEGEVTVDLPRGGPWQRMAVLYEQVAAAVQGQAEPPLVVSGDCTTSLGVLAGLQRRGQDVGIVWFDAHADFHTEHSTTSGYLGGMPLALAAGVGTLTVPDALRLRPVSEARIVLVDARDTDPGEHDLLARSAVVRRTVNDLSPADLPSGPLYLHIDIDVADPQDVPGLLYPTPGGPDLDELAGALRLVARSGRVAAVGLAATWHAHAPGRPERQEVARRLAAAALG